MKEAEGDGCQELLTSLLSFVARCITCGQGNRGSYRRFAERADRPFDSGRFNQSRANALNTRDVYSSIARSESRGLGRT